MRSRHGGERAEQTGPGLELAGSGEVHAWLIDLDALPVGRLLAPAERDRAASYARPRDGARFAASRAWLRLILSRYVDASPAELRFAAGADGRPGLRRRPGGPASVQPEPERGRGPGGCVARTGGR